MDATQEIEENIMDPLTIIQLVMQYGGQVKAIWDLANSNEDATSKIKALSAPLASLLESIGAKLFPKAAPALHIVGGIVAAFDPNITGWLQGALNTIVKPTPLLVVDGLYGPLTRDAVTKLQGILNIKVDGLAGAITQAAIGAYFSKQTAATA